MKIALFSDVHGNLTALKAILADIENQNVDDIIFVGDLCMAGARPAECLEQLMKRQIRGVYGNTDVWVLNQETPPTTLQPLCDWTRAKLSTNAQSWLASLPFSLTIGPTAHRRDALHIVHANPVDVMQVLYPPEVVQAAQPEELQQTDAEARELIGDLEAAILAFGHLHYPSLRPIGNLLLANISSVSLPADGDSRAKYAICQWEDGQGWQIAHQLVAYDVQREKNVLAEFRPPGWEHLAASL